MVVRVNGKIWRRILAGESRLIGHEKSREERPGGGCATALRSAGFWDFGDGRIRGLTRQNPGLGDSDCCGEVGRGFWRRGGLFLAEGCGF